VSRLLISEYHKEIEELIRFGGSRNESALEGAFQKLLNGYARPRGLKLVPKVEYVTKSGNKVYPDGTLKTALRQDWGYWEAKDSDDDLDEEIRNKLAKGYPRDNILFEDGETAVLIQNGSEVARVRHKDPDDLNKLLTGFFDYERPEVASFRRAVDKFKQDLPTVLGALRDLIDQQQAINRNFANALAGFLKLCRESINPTVGPADVREMLIQHMLTEDIFLNVFSDSVFHRHNNIAKALGALEDAFFTAGLRRDLFKSLESYYGAIKMSAAAIRDHHEKQTFLKAVYEDFYKIYNKKAADRLGVVYTPTEIVRFMIEGAEALTYKHFGKLLADKDVEILDPATGTGTYICELIEHLKSDKKALARKYNEELHCNEVAILPYYIANLNIEYTYAQVVGNYSEFPNILFVDTLDNLNFEHMRRGLNQASQIGLLGAMSDENVERIKRQNTRRISVIIGNPPYNANQANENDNNKNREYPGIDRRIKETYIRASTAQKTKLYDMYARFLRWASDRLNHPERGVIAFVSNSSFIDSRSYDGFRKVVAEEFDEIRIIDLKGNARTSGDQRRREAGNVFEDKIRVGIAVYFLVRRPLGKRKKREADIFYAAVPDFAASEEKLSFLVANTLDSLEWARVRPDARGNWVNLTQNDFDELIPLADKETKSAEGAARERAIFKLFSLGVVTARDDWVYDHARPQVVNKVKFLIDVYNADVRVLGGRNERSQEERRALADKLDSSIKWTRAVKRDLVEGIKYEFDSACILRAMYRPYVKQWLYFSRQLNEMQYQLPAVFGSDGAYENTCIVHTDPSSAKPFMVCAVSSIADLHFVGAACGSNMLPLYRYDSVGNRVDNITDWALSQFQEHYGEVGRKIGKRDIFHYVYAALHDPDYRTKYAQNLKRQTPRIPFLDAFWQWAEWGKQLMDLHLNYESSPPYGLTRVEQPPRPGSVNRPRLYAEMESGRIVVDDSTILSEIPSDAWEYKLGNRCALEWILEQYKESTPRDATVSSKFNTYRFSEHKEEVIDLVARVTTVSVETQKIVAAMGQQSDASTNIKPVATGIARRPRARPAST
jgi:predicted helicase